jgi:hypothetical protein
LEIEALYIMKMATPYISPDCELHDLHQVQVICASAWNQNGSQALGYDYDYEDDWEELY